MLVDARTLKNRPNAGKECAVPREKLSIAVRVSLIALAPSLGLGNCNYVAGGGGVCSASDGMCYAL